MTAFLAAAAWPLVLWCSVARQPQGRQIGATSTRPGTTMRARGGEAYRRDREKGRAAMVCDASLAGLSGVGAGHLRRHYASHYVREEHGLRTGLPIRSGVKSIAATQQRHPPRSPVMYGVYVMWQPENVGILGILASRCYGATLCVRNLLRPRGFRSQGAARTDAPIAEASVSRQSVIRSDQLFRDAWQHRQRASDLVEHHPTDPAIGGIPPVIFGIG